ncbi:uncharacterized protein LOC133328906 [Musca vetustissima]|uniref:uncharacterized protein LOC133328906 n=1 Tax=Musca vetustissima TaxID=27455 RepID=UPI002AB5DF6E|nr:uncharacterized protein LOC133328906 [Musca vetustissima]
MAQQMLASRGMRFLMARCRPAPLYTWTVKSTTPAMAASTNTTWYIRPVQPTMTAAYSKDTRNNSPIQPPNIKLPNRDQVQKYFFTALVYVWDFCYYVFCLTLRLVDTYILKNPTLQQYWKQFMKRLDEQREAMKSKK